MLLPLILAVLDEILIRQRHSAVLVRRPARRCSSSRSSSSPPSCWPSRRSSSSSAWWSWWPPPWSSDRARLRRLAPHAAKGLAVGLGVGAVLLAWPVWFALEGPGPPLGPGLAQRRGARRLHPVELRVRPLPARHNVFLALGGYEGAPLASAAYLGWGFLAVLAAGVVAFWRDRRLWFFGFVLVVCVRLLARRAARPVGAGPGLHQHPGDRERDRAALHGHRVPGCGRHAGRHPRPRAPLAPDWRGALGRARRGRCRAGADGHRPSAPRLPFAMRPVILPRWYTEVAPTLPPGRVLLSYPGAVLGDPVGHGVAGGQPDALQPGRRRRAPGGGAAGPARRRAGFRVLSLLDFGVGLPHPPGPPAQSPPCATPWRCGRSTRWSSPTDPAAPATAGPGPHLCRGLHDGRPRPPARHPGGRLGLGQRAARAPCARCACGRARSRHACVRPRAASGRSWPALRVAGLRRARGALDAR